MFARINVRGMIAGSLFILLSVAVALANRSVSLAAIPFVIGLVLVGYNLLKPEGK